MSDSDSSSLFDDNPAVYDALVNWPRRLANEGPFYRRLFERFAVRRVLDAACGTGHHAAMFHSWGLEVEGTDASAAMIARCREVHGESETLRWAVRSFDRPHEQGRAFDAVVCVGNSLALAADMETARRAVRAMVRSLTPGGVCVVHVLNLWRLAEGPTTWQKSLRSRIGGIDWILLKAVHRVGAVGFVDMAAVQLVGDGVESRFHSSRMLGFEADDLVGVAREAGATEVGLYGTYQEDAYDRQTSTDLIMVCALPRA